MSVAKSVPKFHDMLVRILGTRMQDLAPAWVGS